MAVGSAKGKPPRLFPGNPFVWPVVSLYTREGARGNCGLLLKMGGLALFLLMDPERERLALPLEDFDLDKAKSFWFSNMS